MGLFSRSNKTTLAPIEGNHEVVVVGDDQFPVVRTLSGGPAHKVTLERELGNRLDPNAILVRVNGSPAGYLSQAEDYAPMVTTQHSVQAVVKELYPSGRALFVLLPLIRQHHEDHVQSLVQQPAQAEEQPLEQPVERLVEQPVGEFAPAEDPRHLSSETDATRVAG